MKTKKIALCSVMIAMAMILSYLESLIPLFISIPGVKLGLPNIVIMYVLYRIGLKEAVAISLLRIVLSALMFGSVLSMAYSLAGGILSLAIMYILLKTNRFSEIGVSVSGGVMHNIGQIIVAVLVTSTGEIAYYFPILCLAGIAAGICIGIVSGIVIKRVELI